MKNSSIIILSFIYLLSFQILFMPVVQGQNYKPFIDTDKQWNTMITGYSSVGSPATKSTLVLHISTNDTLINETLYQKVVNTGYSDGTYASGDIGFIREDIDEKKVYFREPTDVFYPHQDKLLYDFSLEAGDTTEVFGLHYCTSYSNTYKVVSNGTIQLLNGEERKTWHLEPIGDNVQEADVWIEGIGSLYGMLFPACSQLASISFSLKLLCYYESDSELYMSDEANCYIDWISGLDINATSSFELLPNPTNGKTQIQLAENISLENAMIELYSPSGKLLYSAKPRSQVHTMDVEHLSLGMYLLRLWDGERWRVQKLIKQ